MRDLLYREMTPRKTCRKREIGRCFPYRNISPSWLCFATGGMAHSLLQRGSGQACVGGRASKWTRRWGRMIGVALPVFLVLFGSPSHCRVKTLEASFSARPVA